MKTAKSHLGAALAENVFLAVSAIKGQSLLMIFATMDSSAWVDAVQLIDKLAVVSITVLSSASKTQIALWTAAHLGTVVLLMFALAEKLTVTTARSIQSVSVKFAQWTHPLSKRMTLVSSPKTVDPPSKYLRQMERLSIKCMKMLQ